ncbi:MAG: hypothetical protein WCJ40_14510 [Planctomycetota bacterium]
MSPFAAVSVNSKRQQPQTQESQLLKDSLWMTAVGQIERFVGLLVTFALRWGLSPSDLGVYSGLRLLLDNTNRSSLGVALGAIQKITLLQAKGQSDQARHITNVAATSNTLTSIIYGMVLILWGGRLFINNELKWGTGLLLVGILAILKRYQDFHIAILRSESQFGIVGRLAIFQSLFFAFGTLFGIYIAGFWGLISALMCGFVVQSIMLQKIDPNRSFQMSWDWSILFLLVKTGLPILAANTAWAMLNTIDRALILSQMPDGTTQAGYYSIAILATNWCSDIAGRVGLVVYPQYQKLLGNGIKSQSIFVEAEKASLIMLSILSFLSLWAVFVGNQLLPVLFPKLVTGMAAFEPMLPGSIALAATWPLRQAWTALDRSWALSFLAGIVMIPQYIILKIVALNGSLAEIAYTSSQFQIAGAVLLFVMTWYGTSFDKARIRSWTLAILSIVYCLFASLTIQRNGLFAANLMLDSGHQLLILLIASIPALIPIYLICKSKIKSNDYTSETMYP